jgi:hypothetical protein
LKYRIAMLLADLRADPGPAVAALRRVAPRVERIHVVSRWRALAPWPSTEDWEPDAHEPAALDAWRAAAAAVAPTDVKAVPELPIDALADLALTEDVDLLVAGTRAFESASLVREAARRLGIAALWPGGPADPTPVARMFCAAFGHHAPAAIATFLREHTDSGLDVTIVGLRPVSLQELHAGLQVVGVRARVELLPRRVFGLRTALDIATNGGPFDLVVLARVHVLPLVLFDWPAPLLVVPPARPSGPTAPSFDMTDIVAMHGTLRTRVDEVAVGSLSPAEDLVLAFVAEGRVVTRAMTTPTGEIELSLAIQAKWLGAVRVVDDSAPDALLAVDHRVAVLRPGGQPLLLFDSELPDERLQALSHVAAAEAVEALAIRLRPTRKAAEIRRRLEAAGLPGHVVDARTVLDEGDALDVTETNDPVRLFRVAAKMRAAGFQVSSVLHRALEGPEPFTEATVDAVPGNSVEVELDNRRARTWLLDAIEHSRRSVNMQVYMALDDEVGRAVKSALAAAGARGIAVRVLVDSLHGLHGSFGTENPLLALLAAQPGIELRVVRPDICKGAGIAKRFTPTGARRTGETWYGRTSGTRAMAITGHRTEAMHRHYGSADAEEKLAMATETWGPKLRLLNSAGSTHVKNHVENEASQQRSGDRVWGSGRSKRTNT